MADEIMSEGATPASGSTSDSDGSDEEGVELLVQGRERRKTAGNRYQRELVQEEGEDVDDEDEVALLFAGEQDEVDEEFKSEASDEDDMSSSDDDDQGPNAGADEMEGEKELQKQAKEERAQKRKAKDALTTTAALRKRPRLDLTAQRVAPKKPSKKKERVTWVPDMNSASGRTSLRKQTIQHRASTIARLKESEAQSKITKKIREQRDKERAKNAPKAMTQADRLAEAARVERRNAKSLNRWEEMERQRNEEQAARLAALKDRKLDGPVITWRSAKAKYKAPKYQPPVPSLDVTTDDGPKKKGRKTKAYHEEMARIKEAESRNAGTFSPIMASQSSYASPSAGNIAAAPPPGAGVEQTTAQHQAYGPPPPPVSNAPPTAAVQQSDTPSLTVPVSAEVEGHGVISDRTDVATSQKPAQSKNASFLHGIFDYANLEGEEKIDKSTSVQVDPGAPGQAEGDSESPIKPDEPNTHSVQADHGGRDQTEGDSQPPVKPNEPNAHDPSAQSQVSASTVQPSENISEAAAAPQADAPSSEPQQQTSTEMNISNESSTQPTTSNAPDAIVDNPPPPVSAGPLIEVMADVPSGPSIQQPQPPVAPPTPASPQIPIEEGFMTKNLVTLNDFDDLSAPLHDHFSVFFNTKKSAKPVRHRAELCPITLQPARYRDPATGIGYANLYAYRILQELKEHKFTWSSMLGCYVGRDGAAIARGCPEGFLPKVAT